MKIYNQERGTGKSTNLLLLSDLTGTPIVVSTKARKDYLDYLKTKSNYENAKIITIDDCFQKQRINSDKVFIDEGYDLLEYIMKNYFCVSITAVTDTIPFFSNKN